MQPNNYKINGNNFSTITSIEKSPSWFISQETYLMIDDFILFSSYGDGKEFLKYVGLEMITNMNLSEDKLKIKLKQKYVNAFFVMDKFYFRKKGKIKWHILENDDFKNFHDWLLATLNPEEFSNRLRKIKLNQIMK